MGFGRQFLALLHMNLVGLPARLGPVLTIIIGVTCAVGVLVSMLAMGVGAQREAMGNTRADRAILLNIDAQGPLQSTISKDDAALIQTMPGIRHNGKGDPIAVSEALVFLQARDKTDGRQTGFLVTGVTRGLTEDIPELHLTSGRMFGAGLRELIASNGCVSKFTDFAVGDKRRMKGGEWPVVGNFDRGESQNSCEVYADADTILSAFGRSAYNEVDVMLQSPGTFDELTNAVKSNPSLRIAVKHEAEVAEAANEQLRGILNFVSYFVGSIMALAATIGAANSLYAIVDSRRRELATLRAIGFNGTPIIASILFESVLLALPGALIGASLAWLFFNGLLASPFGASFHLAITPALAFLGLIWALAIGLLSGLLPSLRAARIPVTVALRAA